MQLIFDLVFIDDWHAYEHVRTELQLLEARIPATVAANALRCVALLSLDFSRPFSDRTNSSRQYNALV
jgi:hypothetical protein